MASKIDISAEWAAKAKRMTKIFVQISEDLEREKLIEINEIINNAGKYSNEKQLHQNLRRFFGLVTFKSGISVNLLNQGIRSLLMIQDAPDLGDAVSEPIRKQLVKEFPTLAGMGKIDEKSLQIYLKALEKGKEKLNHIRLMVVGMFGVGKTSLVHRLRGGTKDVKSTGGIDDVKSTEGIDDIESTEGIDVNVKICTLNKDGSWFKQTPEKSKDSEFDKRLTDVMVMSKSTETKSQPSKSYSSPGMPNMEQRPQGTEPTPKMPKSPDPTFLGVEKCKKVFKNVGQTNEGNRYVEHVYEAANKDSYSGRRSTISIWDFAGQSVYYSTHHFFLSSRSIYLLVLDISIPLDFKVKEKKEATSPFLLEGSIMKKDYTCLDAFKFWVTSIYAYTQYRVEKGEQCKPTIVLVGTHGDLLTGNTDEKERMKDDYFSKALEYFDDTPLAKLFHEKKFLVSNTKDAENVFINLQKNITKIAKEQPYWNSETPAKWLPLERSIESEKRDRKKLMKFSEVVEADTKNENNLTDESEIKLFLQMQHFLGNVIYYDAKDLDGTIILNPQWLIDKFKKFVTHIPCVPHNLSTFWTNYTKTGQLHKDLLDYITKPDEDGNDDNEANESVNVVRYMEHLDVIAKPILEKEVVVYIVPCVLKQLTPEEYDDKIRSLVNPPNGKSTYVLCFSFNEGCLPPSVFHRLMATYIKKLPIKKRDEKLFVYNGFGAFKLNSTKTLCIWYADFIIYARITLLNRKNDILLTSECIEIREELSLTITKILQLDQQNQDRSSDLKMASRIDHFKENVLCEEAFLNNTLNVLQSTNKISSSPGLYEVKDMELLADCECFHSRQIDHQIMRNMALRYWYVEPEYLQGVSKWFEERVSENEKFLEERMDDRDLHYMSGLVNASEIPELGKLLKIPDDSIQNKNKKIKFRVLFLLKKWKKENIGLNNGHLKQHMFQLKENMAESGTK